MYENTPQYLKYKQAETFLMTVNGKIEVCETAYIRKLIEYGYLRRGIVGIVPNVVIFDKNGEEFGTRNLPLSLQSLNAR